MSKTPASAKTLAAKVRPITNGAQKEALSVYTASLERMQAGDYARALEGFQTVDGTAPVEIRERARMYAAACERQIQQQSRVLEFASADEQYDYAIACMNNTDFEEAREQLESILAKNREADFAHYGLGILHCMTGQAEECLEHLGRAIEINPRNRTMARSDADFRLMADDPRFTELLYPEAI